MQDTFQWTDELVGEYANLFIKESWEQLGLLKKNITSVEQFKSSKSPKKEWEIVAFAGSSSGQIYQTLKNGRFALNEHSTSFALEELLASSFPIHSVRRLSDASEWQVKETVEIWETGRFTIQSFEISAGKMLVKTDGGTYLLNALVKLPQAILVTSDGVEIFPGMDFWVLNNDYSLNFWNPIKAGKDDIGKWPDAKLFSTRHVAEEYILNNRPLLSLNDVLSIFPENYWTNKVTAKEKLTALVKQKLNQ